MSNSVSYSEIRKWRFCKQAHYFQYVEQIVPRRKPKPLKLGSAIHSLIESWAKGEDYVKIIEQLKSEYEKMFDEEKEYYGDIPRTAERIIKGYVDRYHKEKKDYVVVEEALGPIPFTRGTQFKFRVDRVMKSKEGLLLCETKTCRKIPEEGIRMWDLQTVLYVWALRKLGYNIRGILWDYVRTKEPSVPKVLKNGEVSKRADIDTDYETFSESLLLAGCDPSNYQDILDTLKSGPDRFYRRIVLPVNDRMLEPVLLDAKRSSLEIHYLKNKPVRSVSGFTCPRCSYSSLCYAQLRGLDEDYIRKSEYMNKEEEIEYGEEVEEADSSDY